MLKRTSIFRAFGIVLLIVSLPSPGNIKPIPAKSSPVGKSATLKVLTFNNAGVNPVYQEEGIISQRLIPQTNSDIFLLQEVSQSKVPEFDGYVRYVGSWTGHEYLPIYYKKGTFWRIEEVTGALDKDARDTIIFNNVVYGPFQRGYTALKLKHRKRNYVIAVINTHLGLGGAAPDQARQLLERTEDFRQASQFVVIGGDFNYPRESTSPHIPPQGFVDSNPNDYGDPTTIDRNGQRGFIIDYLFYQDCHRTRSYSYQTHKRIKSDHYAVSANFIFRAP